MNKLGGVIAGIVLVVGAVGATLIVSALFAPILGAIAGYIVGLFFGDTLQLLADMLGIPNAEPYQLGAMLAFVGAFFKSTLSNSNSK